MTTNGLGKHTLDRPPRAGSTHRFSSAEIIVWTILCQKFGAQASGFGLIRVSPPHLPRKAALPANDMPPEPRDS